MTPVAKAQSSRKYPCALCGRAGTAVNMLYSRFTGNRFCLDRSSCEKRKAKLKKPSR